MHDPDAPPLVQLFVRCVTISSVAKELPGKMASNPELRDVYIAVSCPGRPATTRAPPLVSAGSFCEQTDSTAQDGLPTTATCGILSVVAPKSVTRFLLGRPAALLHRIESCFFVALHWEPARPTCRRRPPHAPSAAKSAGVLLTRGRSNLRA